MEAEPQALGPHNPGPSYSRLLFLGLSLLLVPLLLFLFWSLQFCVFMFFVFVTPLLLPLCLSLRVSAGVWSPSLLAAVSDPDTRTRQPEPGRRGPGWAQSCRCSGPRRPRGRRAASPARDGVGRVRRRSGRGRTFRRGVRPVSSANCRGLPPLDRFPFAQRPELKASGPAGADDPDALRHLEHPGRRRPVHAAPSGQRCGRSRGPRRADPERLRGHRVSEAGGVRAAPR